MTKDAELFIPVLPSDEVQRFLTENPTPNWEESLIYLLERYPQQSNGELQWVVEGGAAVRLNNSARRTPNDVDIIARGGEIRREFANSRRFDV